MQISNALATTVLAVFVLSLPSCIREQEIPINVDPHKMEKENAAGEMIFDGVRLRIVDASMGGTIMDPYWCDTYNKGRRKDGCWGLSFITDTEGTVFERDGLSVELEEIYFEDMPETGATVEWTSPYDRKTGEVIGKVFTWDINFIKSGKLSVIERTANAFQVEFEGFDDLNRKISIKAIAIYGGIGMGYSELDSREEVLKRASDRYDLTGLEMIMEPLDTQYESGIKRGTVYFVPKELLESQGPGE